VQASYTGAGFVGIAHYLEPVTYAIGGAAAAAMQSSDLRSTAGIGPAGDCGGSRDRQ
jgi:hypothetical protein